MWVEVDSERPATVTSRFLVVGTGHEVPDSGAYVGTWVDESDLVWHLYALPGLEATT